MGVALSAHKRHYVLSCPAGKESQWPTVATHFVGMVNQGHDQVVPRQGVASDLIHRKCLTAQPGRKDEVHDELEQLDA